MEVFGPKDIISWCNTGISRGRTRGVDASSTVLTKMCRTEPIFILTDFWLISSYFMVSDRLSWFLRRALYEIYLLRLVQTVFSQPMPVLSNQSMFSSFISPSFLLWFLHHSESLLLSIMYLYRTNVSCRWYTYGSWSNRGEIKHGAIPKLDPWSIIILCGGQSGVLRMLSWCLYLRTWKCLLRDKATIEVIKIT